MKTVKYIALFTCIALCSCGKHTGKKKTDLAELHLKGKIESVREIRYSLNDSAKMANADTTGCKIDETRYLYNESGNATRVTIYEGYSMSIASNELIEYDKNGNVTRKKECNGSGQAMQIMEYKYDYSGNKSEIDVADSNGNIMEKEIFKSDSHGNTTEEISYDSHGEFDGRMENKYDEHDYLIEVDTYNAVSDSAVGRSIYIYDSKGNNVQFKEYGKGGKLEMESDKEYNSKNNLTTEKIHFYKHASLKRTEYVYDSTGNAMKILFYDSEEKEPTTTYIREYDKNGNCIKSTEIRNGKVIMIVYWIIEYYK